MMKIGKNSMNNFPRIWNWEFTRILLIEKNFPNSWDITPTSPEKTWFLWLSMLREWRKIRKKFTSLLERTKNRSKNLHLLNNWTKEDMKYFSWLILLTSMSFSSWKNLMVKNWEIAPKKDFNSKKLTKRRSKKKSKKPPMKNSASTLKRF